MRCLLVYDISDDRARTKIADFCLDYGLDRMQYSAFFGKLNRTQKRELMKKIAKRLGKRSGNIQLIPICQKDWERRLVIIQTEEEEDE